MKYIKYGLGRMKVDYIVIYLTTQLIILISFQNGSVLCTLNNIFSFDLIYFSL